MAIDPPHKQKTVLETILEWSTNRPEWQQDALRRIVQNGQLDDSDINELTILCKQGRPVATTTSVNPVPLDKSHLPANPEVGASLSLGSIRNVSGVNNLAPSQDLSFEPTGLTIIYGDNGAGKSGYVRILKRICRSRHRGEIYSNIYAQQPTENPTATITYSVGGVEQAPESWHDNNHPHSRLSAVSVFDSDCASVHIERENDVAFRPFGLDVPDELATACQRVKELLTREKKYLEEKRHPIFLKPTWKENTAVGKALTSLRHDTDTNNLKDLASLSKDEYLRLHRLKEDLSKNAQKAAAEQNLKAENIKDLRNAIARIEAQTTDDALKRIFSLDREAKTKRETARLAAEKAFSGDLPEVGGTVWRNLWESARRYSTQVAYPNQPFPPSQEEVLCLLCQQPLEAEAMLRMAKFEEFIQKDTERQAQEVENHVLTARSQLINQSIATRSIAPNLREVELQNSEIAQQTRRFIASARVRRYALLKALSSARKQLSLPKVPFNPKTELTQLEATIRDYALELQKSAKDEERNKLESELAELIDRATLHDIMQMVQDESKRLKDIHFLKQCIAETATNTITKFGNDIADTFTTPQLRDRFQEEIVKLAADKVRVEIVRSGGRSGSPKYQVRLFANPGAKVAVVLSEGEKTCVALAAFLTELATANHHSTLVFDDPVSSLDHRWRKQVAKRLIEEARNRQIVAFTHDLVFVNDLLGLAQRNKRPTKLITVSRGQLGAGIVSDGLPWKAKSVEDRIDKLEKEARDAKVLYESCEEDEYRQKTANIYNNLRASWERALEDIAFFRVVQRHRDYVETTNLKKVSVLTEADCDAFQVAFKKCCDVTDAHDPSAARNAEAPPPNEILSDIQALKGWVQELRSRQKNIN